MSIRNCIKTSDSVGLLACNDDIEEKIDMCLSVKQDMVAAFSSQAHLNAGEREFLHGALRVPITVRQLVGFLFYPHQQLQESSYTNFNQLPLALKLSILLASEYGFEPAKSLLLMSHLGSPSSMSKGVVERLLHFPFCLYDFSVCSGLKKMALNNDGKNIPWLVSNAKKSKDAVYVLNSCFLLTQIGITDEEVSTKALSLDADTAYLQRVSKILSTPFALENIVILNCLKGFALEGENLRHLVEGMRSSRDSIVIANAGFLFKTLGHMNLAVEMFSQGITLNSKRLGIELLSLYFEQAPVGHLNFFRLPEEDQSGLRAFGIWKLAQCYRYGRKIDRDLVQANAYYLQAASFSLSDPRNFFPELHYDAGDFALYCALSCTKPEQKILALNYARQHFRTASDGGMEAAFAKEDEVTTLHPGLSIVPGIFNNIAKRAVIAGYFKTAQKILNRHGLNRPTMTGDLKPWADAEQIKIELEKLFSKETTW